MDRTTVERIDELWARRLGCEALRLRVAGVHVLEGGPPPARPGVFALARGDTLVLRGDPDPIARLLSRLGSAATLPAIDVVHSALDPDIDRVIGPAFLGYRETAPARPDGAGEIRAVGAGDHATLARLRDAVTDEEWQHAGLAARANAAPIFGAFEGDRLLAVAGFETLLGVAAHIGVVTHPSARGRGAGGRVVAAAAGAAATMGLLLQYQTLESNLPSMRIAKRLAFVPYARSLAVRLLAEERTGGLR